MPSRIDKLKKEKKAIIHDIIFNNIIPNVDDSYWELSMIVAEIRKHNIDKKMTITNMEVSRILTKLINKKHVSTSLINSVLYYKFN